MLTKVILVTTWTTDEKLPFDRVSSIRGANTLFQGGEQIKGAGQRRNVRAEEPEWIRDEKSDQIRSDQIKSAAKDQESTWKWRRSQPSSRHIVTVIAVATSEVVNKTK
jgi:hypothetical protein